MFARLSERTAQLIRVLLAIGWVTIIVSLFWDPLSPLLTEQHAGASPFRLNRGAGLEAPLGSEHYICPVYTTDPLSGAEIVDWGNHRPGTCDPRCTHKFGECMVERPYPMGARIFWSMIIPIIPLFLMVFGHEAWRRICPLSFFSQLPRLFGLQRRRKSINPTTGYVERNVLAIDPDSWLGRNHLFVQFGLLWLGVSARIVFINSDRVALAVFFIGVIATALLVGYLFGGKTWCNFFCPISPVQKIYTEPRGILESRAHLSPAPITQSMCREPTADGPDRSVCVGCTTPCPDIDLERAYWETTRKPGRRFMYYGYFGLVIGFYSYFALYAGNWDYYFSGAWSHEEDQLAQIFDPGFYLFGMAIPIPKLIAAPLTIAVCILLAYGIGRLIEARVHRIFAAQRRKWSWQDVQHKCFAVATFITINAFYAFGGRPNLGLLPPWLLLIVDNGIILISSFWLWRTLWRTSFQYTRERLADSLRRVLQRFSIDFSQYLEGRSLDELSPTETYVLAKTLPGIDLAGRRRVYKDTLRDALQSGFADANSLAIIKDLREQMELSEQEHAQIVMELGIEDSSLLDPDQRRSQENRLRFANYRRAIESLLRKWVEEGTPIKVALQQPKVAREIQELQAIYSITQTEQAEALEELLEEQGTLLRDAHGWVAELERLDRAYTLLRLLKAAQPVAVDLLRDAIRDKERYVLERLLNVLHVLEDSSSAITLARRAARVAGAGLERYFRADFVEGAVSWQELVHPDVREILLNPEPVEQPERAADAEALQEVLLNFVHHAEFHFQAPALYLLGTWSPEDARSEAQHLMEQENVHWLLRDLAGSIVDSGGTRPEIPTEDGYRIVTANTYEKLLMLHRSTFFNHLDISALAALAQAAEVRRYEPGATLCRKDDPSDEMFLIESGSVDVYFYDDHGEQQRVTNLPAGETIGELGVISHRPRTATVVSAEENLVLAIAGQRFEECLMNNARTATSFLRLTSARLQRAAGAVAVARGETSA